MTDVYLACTDPYHIPSAWDWKERPMCVLKSFAYLKKWRQQEHKCTHIVPRKTMLDSGAFTAYTRGEVIDIDALVAESRKAEWTESVGLDVIGDHAGSLKNLEYMRSKGSPAMPVFHIGDPMELLDHYVKHWPKVGLSCLFGEPRNESFRFYEQCFARAWPHRFHSFGWAAESVLTAFPFDSADSSTWLGARRFNRFVVKGMRAPQHLRFADAAAVRKFALQDGSMSGMDAVFALEQRLKTRWDRVLAEARAKGAPA